eukprot:520597-Karenia_brevis.AAC.1
MSVAGCPCQCLSVALAFILPSFPELPGSPAASETRRARRSPRSTPRRRLWQPRLATPQQIVAHEFSVLRISTPPPSMEVDEGIPLAERRRRQDLHGNQDLGPIHH